MKFKRNQRSTWSAKIRRGGFTLAETLAALAFMAIVIPVAIQGIQIASAAGRTGQERTVATRIAERVLSEATIATDQISIRSGIIQEGQKMYSWRIQEEVWPYDSMQLMTATVIYEVHGRQREARLSTLIESAF